MTTIQSKHTPAPWNIWLCEDDPFKLIVVANNNEDEVCGSIPKESDANIIAAAPEMLEALHKARESIIGMKEMLHGKGMAYGLGRTFEMVDEAIAKAEGRDL